MKFRRRNRDLDDEIQSHLSMAARDRLERGETSDAARLAARRELGSEALVKEVTRGMWRGAWLERLAQDLRYAFRQLRAAPGFAISAVLTLALGIGANSAIFSVVNAVLLNPLPFRDADRLVWVWGRFSQSSRAAVSPMDLLDYRGQNRSFQQLGAAFALGAGSHNWSLNGPAQQLQGAMITADLFEALGHSPLLGRSFTRADEQVADPSVAVLSYHLWQQGLGGDPAIIGKTARMDSTALTIVGVMPASLDYPRNTDFWFPLPMLARGPQQRVMHNLRPIGLLKPGITVARAQADLDAIAARLAERYPSSNKGWSLLLQPMQDAVVGSARPALLMLLGAVALVLLIACVNIANLLLARYGAREREIAIRAAIGAGRFRILGQLLTENLVLAFLAGSLALLVARWGIVLLRGFGPRNLPRLDEVRLDGHVLLFTALASVATAIFFGLAPAWLATAGRPLAGLREDARAGAGRRRHVLGAALVVGETALSLCLLIGAALLLESLFRTIHVPPGFSSEGVLSTELIFPASPYRDTARRLHFMDQVTGAIRALPGVEAVGGISEMPLNNEYNDTFFRIAEHPPANPDEKNDEDFRMATPGYFQAMGIPLLRGRLFDPRDQPSSQRVVVVDEPFAARYFPHEDSVGKHLSIYEGPGGFVNREIVGVVGGVRNYSLQLPPRPVMYLPFAQSQADGLHLFVRAAGDPGALAEPIRRIVAAEDPDMAVAAFQTMDHFLSESVSGRRFNALLLGLFAALALVLAVAGVYGVFSYIVTQQTHEIGVRMALGAQPGQMLRLVLRRGLALTAIGAGMGLLGAFFLMRLLANQLYGIEPRDPVTFAGAALLLTGVAIMACFVPARRAMRVDPLFALRYE